MPKAWDVVIFMSRSRQLEKCEVKDNIEDEESFPEALEERLPFIGFKNPGSRFSPGSRLSPGPRPSWHLPGFLLTKNIFYY